MHNNKIEINAGEIVQDKYLKIKLNFLKKKDLFIKSFELKSNKFLSFLVFLYIYITRLIKLEIEIRIFLILCFSNVKI